MVVDVDKYLGGPLATSISLSCCGFVYYTRQRTKLKENTVSVLRICETFFSLSLLETRWNRVGGREGVVAPCCGKLHGEVMVIDYRAMA